jgi:hypothetical protein
MRGIEPEAFHAVEQFLDPATREGLRAWIDDVLGWRTKAMLGSPPMWRLRILRHPKISNSARNLLTGAHSSACSPP